MKLHTSQLIELTAEKQKDTSYDVLSKIDSNYLLNTYGMFSEDEASNILLLLQNKLCTIQEVGEFYRTKPTKWTGSCFHNLFDEKLTSSYLEHKLLTSLDLHYLWSNIQTDIDFISLSENTQFLKYFFDMNVCTFQMYLNKAKKLECFMYLMQNQGKNIFKELIECQALNRQNCESLLNLITTRQELKSLSKNKPVLKYVLKNFILTEELVKKYEAIVENGQLCKFLKSSNIFDFLEFQERYAFVRIINEQLISKKNNVKCDQELIQLLKVNKYVFSFESNNRLKLIDALSHTDSSLDKLKLIVDNNLESTFDDFNELLSYLKKTSKTSYLAI